VTDKVKTLAPQIWDQIQKSQNILLHCHPSPDPDSAGSALAFKSFLTKLGKHVTLIAGDSEIPASFAGLPGVQEIIPKNYFQIDITAFDLFIILDASSLGQISKLGTIVFPSQLDTIIIDHHITNEHFANLSLVDDTYPATGQIIYDLFSLWGIAVDTNMAICLYLAIYADTGGFKYPRTTWETLDIAQKMAQINPDFPQSIFIYENSNAPENILYLGLALHSVNLYFSGHVAISEVRYSDLQSRSIRRIHTEKMETSNYLKSVIGWDIGLTLTEYEPQIVNVSFRTRDSQKYDVSKIALATGFGGGHPPAAGATLNMSFDQAKTLLLTTISQIYPELGSP
jgi:bifunctional oligoribonuclease and PAP phosphatase NrnA